jgi:hypothetical protein
MRPNPQPEWKMTEREAFEQLVHTEGWQRLQFWVDEQSNGKEEPFRSRRIEKDELHNMVVVYSETRGMREVMNRPTKMIEKAKKENEKTEAVNQDS